LKIFQIINFQQIQQQKYKTIVHWIHKKLHFEMKLSVCTNTDLWFLMTYSSTSLKILLTRQLVTVWAWN
jgi:hypothetical protein